MKNIDEARLESDVAYRFGYVSEFMGFNDQDIQAIHGAAEHLAPVVPALVDAVYDKLQQYDCTWRHFVPKQAGFEGDLNAKDVEDLRMDDPQIAFRKKHLQQYLEKLVTAPYDAKMVMYLDTVGKIHTAKAGNPAIVVPMVQINALMGFVSDALMATIMGLEIPESTKTAAVRAFTKLLWIQNDLFLRHYVNN